MNNEDNGFNGTTPDCTDTNCFLPPSNTVHDTNRLIANGKYKIFNRIGAGSFGEIWLGMNVYTNKKVAVKMEPIRKKAPHLIFECKIYKQLRGVMGIPKIHYFGIEGEYNIMVIDLLGPNLEEVFAYCGNRLSVPTVCMLGDQIMSRIEAIHSRGFIHRDIKPQNFVLGLEKSEQQYVHMLDFGLAKSIREVRTGQHILYKANKSLIGTARYVSINTHLGIEQSRRDDVESVCYVLIYLLKGYLPWQGVLANSQEEKFRIIMEKKMGISLRELCHGLPREFEVILAYTRRLGFLDQPDYSMIRRLLKELLFMTGHSYDHRYDWIVYSDLELRKAHRRQEKLLKKQQSINRRVNDKESNFELIALKENNHISNDSSSSTTSTIVSLSPFILKCDNITMKSKEQPEIYNTYN